MVAATTPSPRFRDLLTGMIATMESGGSMKSYLQSMADDAMHTYSLERKKYVEVLSTYSDIYTGILIAAPLLFMVTLAIINLLGGTIGGFSVSMLAVIGTYVVIPLLNIAFVLFLNMMQPEI
jgi:archaellum biogenesis protein FlaJ (TadC family)